MQFAFDDLRAHSMVHCLQEAAVSMLRVGAIVLFESARHMVLLNEEQKRAFNEKVHFHLCMRHVERHSHTIICDSSLKSPAV